MKLLFLAPNTADTYSSANLGPYCSCLNISLHCIWKKNGFRCSLKFIYIVMWHCGSVWRYEQEYRDLSHAGD